MTLIYVLNILFHTFSNFFDSNRNNIREGETSKTCTSICFRRCCVCHITYQMQVGTFQYTRFNISEFIMYTISLMIFRLETKHSEKMRNIKSWYLLSVDMFILLIVNKHRITPNIQHSETSNEYISETYSVTTDECSSSQ